MLPDYLNSFDPLKQRLTGKNEEADQGKVQLALRKILDGKAGGPEFGMVSGSAEEKALRMLGGNTGRFAGNYIIKNYDKLDPMVRELVGTDGHPEQVATYGQDRSEKPLRIEPEYSEKTKASSKKVVMEGAEAKRNLPRVVESAIIRKEKQNQAKRLRKSKKPSFMENIGFQEGGMVPVDGEGNVPPEAVAGDVVNGAPMGMVDVPNGGGPVDDGVPTELPEGTVVINAAAIRLHGTETIDKLINDAVNELLSEGVQISMEDPNPEDDVPVAISNGEYVIPPEVAEKIGYKKLEDMNERGRAYLQKQQAQEKQQAEAQQQPSQPSQQPPEGFMGAPMPQEQAGPPQAPVQSEQQAMAMMGMMGGGRVPYAEGTAAVPAPKVGLIETLQNFMSQFGDNNYVSDMFGGSFESTADDFPERLSGEAVLRDAPPSLSERMKKEKPPKKNFAAPFVPGNMDPAYSDETMPDPGNIFKARKTQARAQGGFVGEYNYAQPQQATMGTPFPNAVDSNPQQSQSFLRPNDAKKKSRVGLADGKKVNSPEEQINTEGKIAAASQRLQEDLDARETLANDRTFQFEMGGGDAQATANIIKGNEEHKVAGQVVYDGRYLVSYMDNSDPPRRTIGGINQDALPDDHPLRNLERVLPADYIEHHQKRLQEANDWVTEKAKSNVNYEPLREVIVDMKFNMTPSGFDEFIKGRFGEALSERNFDKASKELLIGANKNTPSSYVKQVPNRAKANSKLLKLLGEQYVSSVATQNMSEELSDSFVPLPVKSSESVGQRAAKQNAENAKKQKAIYDTRIDQMRVPTVPSEGFTGFNIPK
jgi:hypothetical protein